MKFLTAIKSTFVLLAVVLLNSLTFVGHSAAMSTMSHDMGGMSHNSSYPVQRYAARRLSTEKKMLSEMMKMKMMMSRGYLFMS